MRYKRKSVTNILAKRKILFCHKHLTYLSVFLRIFRILDKKLINHVD